MSDIQIYGYSSVAVDTEHLRAAAQGLRGCAEAAREISVEMRSSDLLASPWMAGLADASTEAARNLIHSIDAHAAEADERAALLDWAAGSYESTDQAQMDALAVSIDAIGWGTGRTASLLALSVSPLAAIAGVVAVRALISTGVSDAFPGLPGGARLIVNPVVPTLLRGAVAGADGAIAGALGLPPPAVQALGHGDQAQRGVEGAARVITGAGAVAGAFHQGPQRVARVDRQVGPGATSVEGLVDRIPPTDPAGAQIRIDRAGSAGDPRWVVYLGGTADAGVVAGAEAFDMSSNVHALAGIDAASERAALEAMRQAGVAAEDPVLLVGYSQGGLIASRVAESPGVNAEGIVTIGSPVSALPTGVPTLELVHSDDIVPALGGFRGSPDPDRISVVREAFAGREPPADDLLAAHHLDEYRRTARLADASTDPRLRGTIESLSPYLDGATTTSTLWSAERVSPSPQISCGGDHPGGGGSHR